MLNSDKKLKKRKIFVAVFVQNMTKKYSYVRIKKS